MEFAVYRIYRGEDGRRMGAFVNMLASREEAEAHARELDGEHEAVQLWTREFGEEEVWDTVVFLERGLVAPAEGTPVEAEEGEE